MAACGTRLSTIYTAFRLVLFGQLFYRFCEQPTRKHPFMESHFCAILTIYLTTYTVYSDQFSTRSHIQSILG